MAAFKEGAAAGYGSILYFDCDADLEPIRGLPEFQKWLACFKKSKQR
jgi:hypothetical protein